MRISVKCSTAVHALLMIAVLSPGNKITSDGLAGSIGCNPVEIRKILSCLKKAGYINVARGRGGATLRAEPEEISLLDIYMTVDSADLDHLVGVHCHPAKECPFGGNIEQVLSEPYKEIGDAVREKMASITLRSLLDRLNEIEPRISEMGMGG